MEVEIMTQKRFVSEDDCCGYYTEIIDKEKELDLSLHNPKKNLTIEELVDLLNNLHEENLKLKGEGLYYKTMLMSLMEEAKRISEKRWKL